MAVSKPQNKMGDEKVDSKNIEQGMTVSRSRMAAHPIDNAMHPIDSTVDFKRFNNNNNMVQ